LTTEFITTGIMPALDEVERRWRVQWGQAQQQKKKELGNGALIITGRRDQDKFFSNGARIYAVPTRRSGGSDIPESPSRLGLRESHQGPQLLPWYVSGLVVFKPFSG
jgi:hypothetical protein